MHVGINRASIYQLGIVLLLKIRIVILVLYNIFTLLGLLLHRNFKLRSVFEMPFLNC